MHSMWPQQIDLHGAVLASVHVLCHPPVAVGLPGSASLLGGVSHLPVLQLVFTSSSLAIHEPLSLRDVVLANQ
jgi:hypothetical protein